MLKEIISRKTRANLEALIGAGILDDYYLVGGTGLALQLKHRISIDLDFFTPEVVDIKQLIQKIKELGNLSVESEDIDSLTCQFNGTKLSFLRYDYPLLSALEKEKGFSIASIKDIACMKIDAVSSRGTRKDFIDLFFICQRIPLTELLKLFQKKYKKINYNSGHILKSLVYFNDAEKNPLPIMIIPVSWLSVKTFFEKEVKKIIG